MRPAASRPKDPTVALAARLDRLGVTEARWRRAAKRHLRQIARDLPLFDSAWVDACLREGLLTPFQAEALDGDRPDDLFVGPFTLRRVVDHEAGEPVFEASHAGGRLVELLRLPPDLRAEDADARRAADAAAVLYPQVRGGPLQWLRAVVEDGDAAWAAFDRIEGETLERRLATAGRMRPAEVAAVAAGVLTALSHCEALGHAAGDVRAGTVRLDAAGRVVLTRVPLSPVLRPAPDFTVEARPELCDGTAPERIGTNAPPSAAADRYAAGCLLWHLLAGRPVFPHGSALGKLREHQRERLPDVTDFAPDTPQALASLIEDLTAPDPRDRPASAAEAAALLGTTPRPVRPLPKRKPPRRGNTPAKAALATAAAAAAFVAYPALRDALPVQTPNPPAGVAAVETPFTLKADADGVLQLPSGDWAAAAITTSEPRTLRGAADGSTRILVDGDWDVFAEDLTIEDALIVCRGTARLTAQNLTLRRCRIAVEHDGPAVRWSPLDASDVTGRAVALERCVVRGGAAVVALDGPARSVAAENVLAVGCEAFVRIGGDWPRRPGSLSLTDSTLREVGTLLAFGGTRADRGQQIDVRLRRCVLDVFSGLLVDAPPAEAAEAGRRLRVSAEGCVASAPIFRAAGGELLAVPDGPLAFAGPPSLRAGDSRLIDAGVPLAADGWPGVRFSRTAAAVPPAGQTR